MSLFPQLSDSYYVDNDHNILKMMDYTYAKNITINQVFWTEADIDARYKSGDQRRHSGRRQTLLFTRGNWGLKPIPSN